MGNIGCPGLVAGNSNAGKDANSCTGTHRYFVANDAAAEGKVIVFLVCTSCGEGKKLEFEVAAKNANVEAT